MSSQPHVAVVVLSWNRKEDTLACLRSLSAVEYVPLDVVLVDNCSSDGTAEAVRLGFPDVVVLETGANLGYAEGNNVGLWHALNANVDYVLLLNNDTEVAPDFVSEMVNAVEQMPQVGIAGPTIYYWDRPTTIWAAGGSIDWRRGDAQLMGLDEEDRGQYTAVHEVDYVTGCALLIRREAAERAGLLDPRFFMYYEETEWCVRVARAGYKIVHVPRSHVWHKISPAQQADSPRVHYYMTRNRLLFLRISRASVRAWVHTLVFEYLRTLASWTLRPEWRAKRPLRPVMIRAIWDAFVGRWGPLVGPVT